LELGFRIWDLEVEGTAIFFSFYYLEVEGTVILGFIFGRVRLEFLFLFLFGQVRLKVLWFWDFSFWDDIDFFFLLCFCTGQVLVLSCRSLCLSYLYSIVKRQWWSAIEIHFAGGVNLRCLITWGIQFAAMHLVHDDLLFLSYPVCSYVVCSYAFSEPPNKSLYDDLLLLFLAIPQ
jgi:hypothetical protein